MSDPGNGESTAGFSPDKVEVPVTLLSLPDLILRRHGVHWRAIRRRSRSVPATPVARSPDTPLSFPKSSSELPPSGKKQPPKVTWRSTCGDSQRVDSLLKPMVRLQSSNGDLPLDLPTETMLRSSEKSGDELESIIRLQSNNSARLLLDLNAFPPEEVSGCRRENIPSQRWRRGVISRRRVVTSWNPLFVPNPTMVPDSCSTSMLCRRRKVSGRLRKNIPGQRRRRVVISQCRREAVLSSRT